MKNKEYQQLIIPFCPTLKKLVLLFMFVYMAGCLIGQSYSRHDSIQVYKWLTLADEKTELGLWDAAMEYAKLSLASSKETKMLRGEGFAKLKIAEILFQQEADANLEEYFAAGLKIGLQLKDSFMLALANYQQGQYLMNDNQLGAAEKLFNLSLQIKFGKEQSNYTALLYNDLGYLYGLKDQLETQARWYLQAIRIYEKTGDINGLATTTSNLATVYLKLGNESKAFEYTKAAIAMREKTGDSQGLATSYENLSRMYRQHSLDSAAKYQQVAMKYAEKTGIKSFMIRSYDNLSVLSDQQRNKPEALAYIEKSIALCRELNDKAGLAGKYRWAALLCGDMNDTSRMESYFRDSYQLAVQLNNKSMLRDYYGSRASYFGKVGDFENAYNNLKKYYAYRDSIISTETATNIAGLQTKYELEKKDFEITKLITAQKIKQLEIEKQKAVIAGNKLEALQNENEIQLLAQQQELRDIKINQQQAVLQKQTIVAENSYRQLQLAATEKSLKTRELNNERKVRYLMTGSMCLCVLLAFVLFNRYQLKKKLQQQSALEKMRTNIAGELHDDIGASLSNINILNELAKRNQDNPAKSMTYLNQAGEDIQRISESISDIVWNISPRYDDIQNLFIRMKRYASDMMDGKNISYELQFPDEATRLDLTMERRRDFYLIFKEAVNNLVKYSKATKAKVIIQKEGEIMRMVVCDNGIGFNSNLQSPGNGIYNMQRRAANWKDSLEVKSEPGKGTEVILELHTT